MLDADTKRQIDTLRDILVGKIPNPQSQVEQITTGLIYKFMDDMDQEAVELGGEKSFFTGDYEKYAWKNLFDPKLGGSEKVKLYSEAVESMYLNPTAPQLFREIFKNAFLPFKDSSTLNMFLKGINEFHYSHSEKLGDAFEYLLSFMGSQGDAGQFRTPRHIIDFIVEIVNPQKHESILDPACGSAGFLISSYKHILNTNTDKKVGDRLSAEDRKKIGDNLSGYDISPEMIRLSLVNMYLNGFQTPKIEEYDTLSNEDKWNEYYDAILANPPFFSPKGGIQPHKRFSVSSKKAEVLFTSYILDHLKPNGRAGIIVPEGIIFESRTKAYIELRKQLLENGLIGVISLPAGVFKPYSGVKTSILIVDKKLSKLRDSIFFLDIKNDGFDLGDQRTAIKENDLPVSILKIKKFMVSDSNHDLDLVHKDDFKGTDYSFVLSKYSKDDHYSKTDYEVVDLGSLVDIFSGSRDKGGKKLEGIPSIGGGQISDHGNIISNKMVYISEEHYGQMKKGHLQSGDILIVKDGATTGKTGLYRGEFERAAINEHVFALRSKEKFLNTYLYYLLRSEKFKNILNPFIQGIIGGINLKIKDIGIPLPPLEVRQEIIDELEGYQKIIDGCKQVVENYKPTIDIDPSWEMVELGEISSMKYGLGESASDKGEYRFIRISDIDESGLLKTNAKKYIDISDADKDYILNKGDILMARTGATYGKCLYFESLEKSVYAGYLIKISLDIERIKNRYFWYFTQSYFFQKQKENLVTGGGQPQFNANTIKMLKVPLPPLSTQEEFINSIQEERKVIEANKKLIEIYTQKIQDKINKVWGEN